MLANEADIDIDPATAALPMSLPAAVANEEWAQSGGNAAKSVGHVALGTALGVAWTVSIGEGSGKAAGWAAAPVVADGKVFTMDTIGTVRAFDARNGGAGVVSTRFGEDSGNNASHLRRRRRLSTAAGSTPPTASAMSPRSTRATARRCGRSGRAARCAASRRSPTAPSM